MTGKARVPRVPGRTTPGFVFSLAERVLQDCLGPRAFGKAEIAEVTAFFGADPLECVYCGSQDVSRWDHLVPVSKGGETVLGNMVPACARCDDSRQHKGYAEWMRSDAKWSPASRGVPDIEGRLARLRSYVDAFGYSPRTLEERLDERERAALASIRVRLQEIRQEIDALIAQYRERTGNI